MSTCPLVEPSWISLIMTTSPVPRYETDPFGCFNRLPGVLFQNGVPASPCHVLEIQPFVRYKRLISSTHCHFSPVGIPFTELSELGLQSPLVPSSGPLLYTSTPAPPSHEEPRRSTEPQRPGATSCSSALTLARGAADEAGESSSGRSNGTAITIHHRKDDCFVRNMVSPPDHRR